MRVRLDRPLTEEGAVALAGGPRSARAARTGLFSDELFEELAPGAGAVKFRDRVVLVTGARRGIGRSIALRFAEEGARLAPSRPATGPSSLRPNDLERAAALARDPGATSTAAGDAERAADRAEAELGPIDVLVNNAGTFLWRPFLEARPGRAGTSSSSTNLTGAANFCRAVLPGMIGRRRGRIVNVSSIHGVRGEANLAAHSAAKFGLIGLTQSLAREYRSSTSRSTRCAPGPSRTARTKRASPRGAEPLAEKLWPRDVARTVLFLASDDAAAITGAALEVLGGTAPDHPAMTSRRGAAQPVMRCPWAESDPLLRAYHDGEWGVPPSTTAISSSC